MIQFWSSLVHQMVCQICWPTPYVIFKKNGKIFQTDYINWICEFICLKFGMFICHIKVKTQDVHVISLCGNTWKKRQQYPPIFASIKNYDCNACEAISSDTFHCTILFLKTMAASRVLLLRFLIASAI